MLKKFKNTVITTAVSAMLLCSASTVASQVSDIKHELQQKLASVAGFKAEFNQDVIDADGNLIQQSNGHLAVKRPNFLHWQTLAPDETLVISDGQTLWFYNPFVEQVSAYAINNAVANTPILLLTGLNEQAWDDYRVEKQLDDRYLIVSKDENAQVISLQLTFANGLISTFTVTDATGQLSQFRLTDMVTTPQPSPSLFMFELPEGVDLDDQR
ncbi:outer membrane lipoprotein chaperone LolA [Thalassotalea maritima]|uniref:outer membrane lipoprotein chaperone LolA n=1 Tax=Thalassotalea maritima TaxID=3242416 RepID=UPI0035287FF8